MKIRSITNFFHPGALFADQTLENLTSLTVETKELISSAGLEAQTTRLSTPPFPTLCPSDSIENIILLALNLEEKAKNHGFNYLSLGPALIEKPESYKQVPLILESTDSVFLSGMMIGVNGISLSAIRSCAEAIVNISTIDGEGFTNLRFAALANVEPFCPFFPASYGQEENPSFAFALEAADIALESFSNAGNLKEAQEGLIQNLESAIEPILQIAAEMSRKYNVAFKGVDLSLAPFPSTQTSIGNALERLGLTMLGQSGSIAAAAFLASTIDLVNIPRIGFSGLMLPILEDSILAARIDDCSLSLKDLLLFSTVCGTGLDTIPLPGNATVDQIYAILLDICAISQRLKKPLTARLMPIPGKKAGEKTHFKFDYFANCNVMQLDAAILKGNLAKKDILPITSKNNTKSDRK